MPLIETILIITTCVTTTYAIISETLGFINRNKEACKSIIEFIYKACKECTSNETEIEETIELDDLTVAQARLQELKKNK